MPAASFHRLPFIILSVVVLVIAGSLTYYISVWREPPGPEYSWGGNSTLGINLTLERRNISIGETLNYTITLKNTGWESIRVYIDFDFPTVRILNGTIFVFGDSSMYAGRWLMGPYVENFTIGAARKTPVSDPTQFNRRLVVLGPGEDLSCPGNIFRGAPGDGGSDIHAGANYTVQGYYSFQERRDYPCLPCWHGNVFSGVSHFSVLP